MSFFLTLINDLYFEHLYFTHDFLNYLVVCAIAGFLFLVATVLFAIFTRGVEHWWAFVKRDEVDYRWKIEHFIYNIMNKIIECDKGDSVCLFGAFIFLSPFVSSICYRYPVLLIIVSLFFGITFLTRFSFDIKKLLTNHINNKKIH